VLGLGAIDLQKIVALVIPNVCWSYQSFLPKPVEKVFVVTPALVTILMASFALKENAFTPSPGFLYSICSLYTSR